MTSITMASRCLDNLLPPGARRQREADYLCLTATSAIMYHSDGSTVNTTGVPAAPQPAGSVCCSYVFLTWRAGPAACHPPGAPGVGRKQLSGFHCLCAQRMRGKHSDQGQKLDPVLPSLQAGQGWGKRLWLHSARLPLLWAYRFASWGQSLSDWDKSLDLED